MMQIYLLCYGKREHYEYEILYFNMMDKQVRKRHWLALTGPGNNNNYFNLNSQNNFKHAEIKRKY